MSEPLDSGRPRPSGEMGIGGAEWRSWLADWWGWLAALAVLAVSIAFVSWSRMQPEYDAFGWLDWGRQALHWNLNTNGAPSWKPLTFLFTFPYALAENAQPFLWMVTAVAAAFAGAVFAARIAHRLTGPCLERPYVPWLAAAFAAVGIIGIGGFWPQVLISSSDPMVVTLCLAAIDCHLSRRFNLAFVALVLASLGRPEVWPFLAVYAAWSWRARAGRRVALAAGLITIPAMWFGISALTAKSWLRAGDVALNTSTTLHGTHVITGVISRFFGLYEWPVRLAAAAGVGFAIARRDRRILVLAGAAVAWIAIEIGFAFHGWPAVPRYLMEPAAVMVVLAATAVGRLLAVTTKPAALRWAAAGAVILLIGTLVPIARQRVSVARTEIAQRRHAGALIARLDAVIDRDGVRQLLACGQPVSVMGYQSTLAYELGLNVGFVGHKPGRAIGLGMPIVLFKPHDGSWLVWPFHVRGSDRVACDRLRTKFAVG